MIKPTFDYFDTHRIYLVMPKVSSGFAISCGQATAQAGHLVSKLKLQFARSQKNALEWVEGFAMNSITTISLKARDEKEINHVLALCHGRALFTTTFFDINEPRYGFGQDVLTGVAIGPVDPSQVVGITDYLPLWDCETPHGL